MRVRGRKLRVRGFTLLETIIAAMVMAIASMMLIATVSSQQKLNSLAREKSIASNAIRSYIEHMRQQYPAPGDGASMTNFFNDITTPCDFIPTVASTTRTDSGGNTVTVLSVEKSALGDARGLVLKMADETGANWQYVSGVKDRSGTLLSNAWLWTNASMSTVGTITSGSMPTPSTAELDSLGYMQLGMASTGRDLDGNGTMSTTIVAQDKQLFVPCQISISWKSSSTGSGNATGRSSRQVSTLYAAFGPEH